MQSPLTLLEMRGRSPLSYHMFFEKKIRDERDKSLALASSCMAWRLYVALLRRPPEAVLDCLWSESFELPYWNMLGLAEY